MKRVVIIGGGISGLATAHHLLELTEQNKTQTDIILLEASLRPGGIVKTETRDGFLLEHGPDSFISEKPAALELAKRLGLESHLIQTNEQHRQSFVVRNRRLLPVPKGFHLMAPSRLLPFLKSPIFSWSGKLRIVMEMFRQREVSNGNVDESLASFVRRRFGREALERMAQPMIGGIYTADPEQLSLRATFPRFLDWEQQYGSVIRSLRRKPASALYEEAMEHDTSGARYSLFLSFDRGMQLLTDELSRRLNDKMRLGCQVKRLELDREKLKWHLITDHNSFEADAICLTTPAYVSAALLRETHPQLATELDEIRYESSGTINLAYSRDEIGHQLDGFGFVVPYIEDLSLIACTFSSVKFPGRAPEGHVLLRAFIGGALQRETMQLDSNELVARVKKDLTELLGISGRPLFETVTRWERAMPQYHVGHLDRLERIRNCVTDLPGLSLAGAAYSGVGIPDCVRSGERAAEAMT